MIPTEGVMNIYGNKNDYPTNASMTQTSLRKKAKWLIFFLIEVQLIYNVVPICAVQQSDLVIHIYTFFSHYGLPWEVGCSSQCSTVGPRCSSILNVMVCIYQAQTPSPPHSLPCLPLATSPPGSLPRLPLATTGLFLCLWVCFCFVVRFICAIF